MTEKVNAIPTGYHAITPYLIIRGAAQAIDFYKQAFGAVEIMRMAHGDKIGHAEIKIGDSFIMLADEFPEMGYQSPQALNGTTVSLVLYIEDVDTVFQRAVDAGAEVKMALENKFYGDRMGTLADPFGHTWSLATHIEDVTPEEMQKRMEAFCKQQGAA
jgi:PhnB protein